MRISIPRTTESFLFVLCLVGIVISTALTGNTSNPEFDTFNQGSTGYKKNGLPSDTPAQIFRKGYVCQSCGVSRVHAVSMASSNRHRIYAFWWGGSREGGKDVSIFMSHRDRTQSWSKPKAILNIEQARSSLGRYAKKLGNVAAIVDREDRMWLFFVSVSAGGWSGSSINFIRSEDGGKTWERPRKIITSPFFNVSTLVRSQPFLFNDGTIGIPIYHEFVGKFSELLRINPDGVIVSKRRLTWGRHSLQPTFIISSGTDALALHRQHETDHRKIIATQTKDGGAKWGRETLLPLPNPDAAVAALRAWDGKYLLVFNNQEYGRSNLSIAVSTDEGRTWKIVHELENTSEPVGTSDEYSYPSLVQARDGMFHVAYTWKRSRIAHATFSPSWIDQKLLSAGVKN